MRKPLFSPSFGNRMYLSVFGRQMKNNDLVCHNCCASDHRSYSLPDASCFFLDSSNVNLSLFLFLSRVITSDCHESPLPPTSHFGIGRTSILLLSPAFSKSRALKTSSEFLSQRLIREKLQAPMEETQHRFTSTGLDHSFDPIREKTEQTDREREKMQTRMMVYYRVSSSSEVTRTCRCRWISRKAWLAFYFPIH